MINLSEEENPVNKNLRTLNDNEIIYQIVKNGKKSYYVELISRYHKKIIAKCYGLLKDHSLSKEFANDILSKAYEKLPDFQGSSSFATWLYTIAYNHCIDFLRKKKRLHYPSWNNQNVIPEIIDEQEEDFTDLNYTRLIAIMDKIHPEEKALILMKYQDGLSLKQIAIALQISESALKMRLKRAKSRILFLYKNSFGN